MNKFVRSLITEWRKLGLPFEDETVVVAVSGGADSMSLLLAINDLVKRRKLRLDFIVAHFNHKLRGRTSDADERFVRDVASDLGIQFAAGHGHGKIAGNVEEKARIARYRFLAEVARENGASWVLTAHTINDQAETFLLNLIRGSGPDGLRGMRPTRDLGENVVLARPLLRWATRDDTEQFCSEQKVTPRTDEMNADERFTRVRIRRSVLPELAKINPKIVETLARTAELIGTHTSQDQTITPAESELKLSLLRTMSKADLYSRLRDWLRSERGNLRSLELKHMEAIERLIHSPKSGKTAELPGGGRVVKERGRLVFRNIKVEK